MLEARERREGGELDEERGGGESGGDCGINAIAMAGRRWEEGRGDGRPMWACRQERAATHVEEMEVDRTFPRRSGVGE